MIPYLQNCIHDISLPFPKNGRRTEVGHLVPVGTRWHLILRCLPGLVICPRNALHSVSFLRFHPTAFFSTWSSLRPISNSQLHASLHFHLCPIYLVVFKGSYFFRMGYLILRGASRLDAFSVYPFRTWLPCCALGSATGTPAVRPSRSSRTKDSSSQISYAHAG